MSPSHLTTLTTPLMLNVASWFFSAKDLGTLSNDVQKGFGLEDIHCRRT